MSVENFYTKIRGNKQPKCDNDIDIADNSRILIVGKSGGSKTNIALNLLKHLGFDNLVLCAKDTEEPLYNDYLIKNLRKLEKQVKEPILSVCNEIADIPHIDEFDPKKKNVILLDDQILSKNENVKEIFLRGRKKGITTIYISQSFFHCDKFIRSNLDYVILTSISSTKNLKRILSEYNANDISPEILIDLHKRAREENPMAFILIDLKTGDSSKKYRICFDKYIDI